MTQISTSFPTFTTERLILRPVAESDIPAVQRNFSDYEIVRHLSSRVPWPYPPNGAASWFREVVLPQQGIDRWVWAITLKGKPDELIGVVDLWRKGCPEHRGFWLAREHWGNGYMTEAVMPVTDYAFDVLGFDALIFSNAAANARSGRVKEKCGARRIGEQPSSYVDPALTMQELWELTKEGWRAHRVSLRPV